MKRNPAQASPDTADNDGANLTKMIRDLTRRALELAASNEELHRGVARGDDGIAHLRAESQQSARLLAESRRLQTRLRQLARRILTSNEDKRRRMSTKLRDEIAQTLLGIHVRLLALGRELEVSSDSFTQEIATTQRLVKESVESIQLRAQEFDIAHET